MEVAVNLERRGQIIGKSAPTSYGTGDYVRDMTRKSQSWNES